MGRLDALRQIERDKDLKDEILTKLSDDNTVLERLGASAPGGTVLESLPGPSPADAARTLIENPPDEATDLPLEAIVLVMGRPVLLIRNDDYDLSQLETDTWRSRLDIARPVLTNAIRSVGRIDLDNNPQFDWVGTGWVIADDIIVTNRHVASVFARRLGDRFVFRSSMFDQTMGARLDFAEEFGSTDSSEFRIIDILHIEEDGRPDMAFLRVDWTSNTDAGRRPPLVLAEEIDPLRSVAIVGYPAKDTRTNIPADMDRIFGEVYNVKRLAPGDITGFIEADATLTHDCTTLGGNSGSVVLDMQSGQAVGLHFAGREKDRNFAVPASTVRARLEQLQGSASGPGVIVGAVAEDLEAAPTVADMEGRDGYNPAFLGAEVGHPGLSRELQDALAPVDGRDDGILDYMHYSVRMHRLRRLAIYAAVNIDGTEARNVRRGTDKWSLDPRIDTGHQVGNELYIHNKLDRGHLVRRLDPGWGNDFDEAERATLDTFFYTNCAPQHKTLNRNLWLRLEDHILSNTNTRDLKVSVFTGPIFRDVDRKYRDFLIPEDFWKVVALVNEETGNLSVTGYIVSQRDFMDDLEFAFGEFKTYQVPLATVEEQTDLDFGELKEFDPLAKLETFSVRPLSMLAEITL